MEDLTIIPGSPGAPTPEELKDACVTVVVSVNQFGVNRKLKKGEYETAAADTMTTAGKKLTIDPRYKAIRKIDRAVDRWLTDRELEAGKGLSRPGEAILPVTLVEETVEKLEEFKAEFETAVAVFIEALPEIKERAARPKSEGGLGALYKESDWPSASVIKSRYSFEWDIETREPVSEKSGLSSRLVAISREKARAKWVAAGDNIEAGLYEGLTKLLAKLTAVLGEDQETGKKRIFQESTVENFRDFLALLPKRNVTGNGALGEVADKCLALLDGTDAQAIRDSDSLRGMLREKFTAVAKELVETSSTRSRQFNFGKASGF